MAGLISEVELGAQSVLYGLANIAYMVYFHSCESVLFQVCVNTISEWPVFSSL